MRPTKLRITLRLCSVALTAAVALSTACTGSIAGNSPSGSAGNNGNSGGTAGNGSTAPGVRDPGRVTIRRLNRVEYDNTVRDLLGTKQTFGATLFPDDAPQVGFDNNGDLQTISPVQLALYEQAAEALAAEAVVVGSAERARLITCDLTQAACKSTLVTDFGLRAFRRPLAAAEVTTFVNLMATAAQAGATPDEQFRTVLEAFLLSPNFLFRPEIDTDPVSLTPHLLGSYEAASRLSYMIYRSMPDQPLLDAAAAGTLAKPADVQAQLQRMLADPKGVFGQTFASQWLGTTVVTTQAFDPVLFPKFNSSVASSMSQEVTMFFNDFLAKNSPVSQLLTANFSFIDNNLASLYGVPAVGGTGLTRTTFSTPQRGGLLTMAGIMAVTSYPTRTSVVKRGAWVLGQLLCAPPPAPPPNIPPFPEGPITATTQKEILAQHRQNTSCAACHDSMDNIGIALENYDAVGAYRTMENGIPIDAAGKYSGLLALPAGGTGPTFTGAQQLAATLSNDDRFVACVAKNVMTYSLGRQLGTNDNPYLGDISTASQTGPIGVRDVLMNVVASDAFRMRRGNPTLPTGAKP